MAELESLLTITPAQGPSVPTWLAGKAGDGEVLEHAAEMLAGGEEEEQVGAGTRGAGIGERRSLVWLIKCINCVYTVSAGRGEVEGFVRHNC